MPLNLDQAQGERRARAESFALSTSIEVADVLCDAVEQLSNADRVGPEKRKKLSGLLNHYRKMAHPFTACVRDNTKRFGLERAKKVCAVLTDIEKGTTKWRNGGKKKAALSLADVPVSSPVIDDELFDLLADIGRTNYREILGLVEEEVA